MESYKFLINNKPFRVIIKSKNYQKAIVEVNGMDFEVYFAENILTKDETIIKPQKIKKLEHRKKEPPIEKPSKTQHKVDTKSPQAPEKQKEQNIHKVLYSPLPGVVTKILVSPGNNIKQNDLICILEAMKMENEVRAKIEGTVSKVFISQGQTIQEGDPILQVD